ncbi:hypothetical protein ACSBOB_11555 [Mesorhizobium sp. ASY16-5R]|uniref:hypothetical protein n=1 Tax=Mesorhizobium sp. ASY16-5R TaxID=3445772 RepID=UPI003FA18A48
MENHNQAEEDIKASLAHEIYEAVLKINPKSDLLFVLGSYKDTRNDVETLMRLKYWNSTHVATQSEGALSEAPLIPRGIL